MKYIFQRSSYMVSTKQIILLFFMNRRHLKMNLVYLWIMFKIDSWTSMSLCQHSYSVQTTKPTSQAIFATMPQCHIPVSNSNLKLFSEPKSIFLLQCFKSNSTYRKFLSCRVLIELLHQLKLFTIPPLYCYTANHNL